MTDASNGAAPAAAAIDLRAQILENPGAILEDREVMRALLEAGAEPEGRRVVDLRAKLVERLEARLDRLEEVHRTVIAAAYENLAGTNQVHRAVLALLEAGNLAELLGRLDDEVVHILSVDAIRLGLETAEHAPGSYIGPSGPTRSLIVALPPGGVAAYLGEDAGQTARRVTLRRATRTVERLHGPGGYIESEAVLRLDLGEETGPAVLSMGAEESQRFTADQGTDLLTFFAGVLERVMRPLMP